MQPIHIAELTSQHHPEYRAFFTTGLIQDEDNFRITPTDDADATFPTLGTADSFTLGAYVNGTLGGVVSFTRDGATRQKLRHKGILFRMYVSPAYRGRGIARALIEAVIARARLLPDMEQINLTVVSSNPTARALYEKLGFVTFGTEPNAIKWKGRYFDEQQMVLRLA
jgi:RimJ/RimL family protein N-acetyltransferase